MTTVNVIPPASVRLTRREAEILALIVEGKPTKEVADKLFISKSTVDFHMANVYEKLQVKSRVQAYRKAVQLGLVD